jgi:hypothetical protein
MRHPVSVLGAALVTLSAFLFLIVYGLELFGWHTNPYIGIVFFLVMPGVFVAGLLVIPLGVWLDRRQRARGQSPRRWPVIDLANPRHARTVAVVAILTLANVAIVTLAAFRGVHHMDSVEFCGQVCHEVMQPEFVSYQAGPHARVGCVECHIGPGAPWFVRAKLSGLRQVYSVAFEQYSRPIPSPVHNLRPARETCEQCHWPEKFHGEAIRAFREYGDDEANTETVTVMRLHVGGGTESAGPVRGIHWHTSAANQVDYIATDEKRQNIPWVRLSTPSGSKVYVLKGASKDPLAGRETRRMDCMDCHNRPSHSFARSARRAVDQAIAVGQIDRALPFVRKTAVALLEREYGSTAEAVDRIERGLRSFYRLEHPVVFAGREAVVDQAISTLQRLYAQNVFPSMRVTWGTYENNLGHTDSPGCFRCHDDEHVAEDGSVIRQDCELCHAQE